MTKTKPEKMKNTENKAVGTSGKTLLAVLIALLLVMLLLGGALLYFLVLRPEKSREVKGGQREASALQGSIHQMTEEEIQQALNNIVEEGMFRISIASDILAEEDGEAEVRIENNLSNRYVMQVTLYAYVPDEKTGATNEVEIYRTDLIDPGYYIQTTPFDKHLDPGEYDALAVFSALYPDTEELVGTAGAQVKLYVFPKGAVPEPTPEPSPAPAVSATPAASANPEATPSAPGEASAAG